MKTDFKTVRVEITDGTAVLTLDNPPVNQMAPQLGRDFGEAITGAYQDPEVKALVITGTDKNFIAGADITQLQAVKTREEIFEKALAAARFLNSIEIGPKPVVRRAVGKLKQVVS